MSVIELKVELREKIGHQAPKVLRKNGIVPGIFYAHGEDPIPLSVDEKELQQLLHHEVTILDVQFQDGKVRKSIFREIQKDPVTERVIHVDILGVKLTEKIRMTIPLTLIGTPLGVKDEGGILSHLLREVEVEALPLEIPEHLEVDVTSMEIGDVITLEQIPEDKFKFVTEIHHAIANVVHPKVVEEVVEEEELEEGELVEGEEVAEAEEETKEKES